jgi:uracil-DNA glycosylase family 4
MKWLHVWGRPFINERPMSELGDALRFYQDLGFEELYKRKSVVAAASAPTVAAVAPAASPAQPFPMIESLDDIRADLGDCTRCKLHFKRNKIVFGSGNPKAEVVFVGEGPGADEDLQGLPFVGRAGQLLTQMIDKSAERMGVALRRDDVYICNVVKCRPPENRTPERDEMETCSPFLLRQLAAIKPRAIVVLGATAARALLGKNEPMHRLRGQWFDYQGSKLLVTFHPAYLLRDPNKKKEAWEDMQQLFRFLYGL